MSLRDRLIGAWELRSYVDHPVDGGPAIHPFGEDAKGMLLYTPDGFMSAQLMRVGRPDYASGDWFRGTPEEYQQAGSYIAYSGRFEVDEGKALLTHGMFVSFYPGWVGQTQIRAAELGKGSLVLTPLAPIRSGGRLATPRLEWRRAGLG